MKAINETELCNTKECGKCPLHDSIRCPHSDDIAQSNARMLVLSVFAVTMVAMLMAICRV